MSGYVPRKVSNARMRTKTNQTGLKMQGSASTLGRRGYIQRYVNRRVQTGFGVDGYPTGYRCINGVNPVTASDEAKECNCYYARDIRINQVVLAPQPKHQGLAGGVGRINVPRFGCNVTCSALNRPGDPNHHPHFHPPIIPHIKPEPIPGEVPPFSVTMQHYGIASEEFENHLSFANAQLIGPETSSDDWTTWTSEFKQYATSYLNFIQKLQNTTPKDAKKPIYVDRVMFNINGNPGPGKQGDPTSIVKATPYSLLINPTSGGLMDGSSSGTYDYPMIYKHFVKPFIKKNFNGFFKHKVQLGFTFDMSAPWNTFLNTTDVNGRLNVNNSVVSNNFSSNNSGSLPSTKKNYQTKNGAVNQTFRYIGAINDLILADTELDTIRTNNESLYWLVSSASYDDEGGNSSRYPDLESIATNMWELQVANGLVNSELANIPPNYSATGDMGYGNNNITLDNVGPDRIYQEIYDLDPTAAKCSSSYPGDALCCGYYFGSNLGEIGWGVKITQNVPGKDPNPPTFGARNCPTNNNTPNYKGTLNVRGPDSTNSKYFTLANLNPTTAASSVIPLRTDPFGMKNKLNDPNFTKKGTPGTLDTEFNGYVLMFSVNRVGYKVDKTAGEDMFGTWKYDQFTDFLGYAAKYLSTSAKGPGIKNPLIGIYEFDMIPSSWK